MNRQRWGLLHGAALFVEHVEFRDSLFRHHLFQLRVVDAFRAAIADVSADVFVVTYSDHVEQVIERSPADPGLKESVGRIGSVATPGTDRRAVLNEGLARALAVPGASDNQYRKGLVVIGEGNDNGSEVRFSRILDTAAR